MDASGTGVPQAIGAIMNNIPRKHEGQTSTNPAKLYKSLEADVNKITPQYSGYFALSGKLQEPVADPLFSCFAVVGGPHLSLRHQPEMRLT